jgi:hypothetical protein
MKMGECNKQVFLVRQFRFNSFSQLPDASASIKNTYPVGFVVEN